MYLHTKEKLEETPDVVCETTARFIYHRDKYKPKYEAITAQERL